MPQLCKRCKSKPRQRKRIVCSDCQFELDIDVAAYATLKGVGHNVMSNKRAIPIKIKAVDEPPKVSMLDKPWEVSWMNDIDMRVVLKFADPQTAIRYYLDAKGLGFIDVRLEERTRSGSRILGPKAP